MRAKSSLFAKTGCILSNGVGTIDSDYREEILISLYNLENYSTEILVGTAVAQIVIGSFQIQIPEFGKSQAIRTGGFGSTDGETT